MKRAAAWMFAIALAANAVSVAIAQDALRKTVRVAVLVSNPVLITRNRMGLGGISVDLGQLIAARLQAPYQEVVYDTNGDICEELWHRRVGHRHWSAVANC